MDVFLDYDLPAELIAQAPAAERDQARLLVLRREGGPLEHRVFADLPELLRPTDLLVLNDTQVVPARLRGRRASTGGKWEGLFLSAHADGLWELIGQTRGTLTAGEHIAIDPGPLTLELVRRTPAGHWLARPSETGPWVEVLQRFGSVPLPPYIRKGQEGPGDRDRYQTVYARQAGAVAAPTAGLHFTPRLFDRLRERGIEWAFVTLHVGIGTFQPIQAADYRQHVMHAEWGEMKEEAAAAIRRCRERGGRVIAVGTTTARLLESAGKPEAWSGETRLFIHPPYTFRMVDGLITNFHLPRSTLLLLVGALAGERLREAYTEAIAQRYRFYSYGDALLVI